MVEKTICRFSESVLQFIFWITGSMLHINEDKSGLVLESVISLPEHFRNQKASHHRISCTLDINVGACEEANVSPDSLTMDRPRCTSPLLFLTAGQDPARPEALFLVPV